MYSLTLFFTFLLASITLSVAQTAPKRTQEHMFVDISPHQVQLPPIVANKTSNNYLVEFRSNYTYPNLSADLSHANITHTLLALIDPPGVYAVFRGAAISIISGNQNIKLVPGFKGVAGVWKTEPVTSKGSGGVQTWGGMFGEKIE